MISKEGVKPDATRVRAIKEFPVPKDTTGVKSFLGLTNQLSFFIPDHIQNSKSLRELCGRGVVFNWLPEHQFEFETIKTILSANLLNRHFDPKRQVFLLTDASRHHGLGFALCQKTPEDHLYIVTCGSKSLTDTQKRYSTIELECLAIKWAILKCPYYLFGLPTFTVLTDHRPLEGVFKKTIFDLPNPRLQRMREKLAAYNFIVTWVPGKTHLIADALSRAPLFTPEEHPDLEVDTALSCLTMTKDPSIHIISDNIDEDYKLCVNDILHSTNTSKYLKCLLGIRDRLSVSENFILLDSKRIVAPSDSVPHLLRRLHTGHCGQEKTLKLAQSLFYWPGMNNDIKTYVSSCRECFAKLPSQCSNPCVTEPPSSSFGPPRPNEKH